MVRLALALLWLLAAPAVVRAETAWVLWVQTMDPWGAVARLPQGSWPSREACEQERAKREQRLADLPLVSYACLPDSTAGAAGRR